MTARAVLISAGYTLGAMALIMFAFQRGTPILFVIAFAWCAFPLLMFLVARVPWIFVALPGVALGFMPFAAVPGTGAPLVVALAVALVPIALMHPTAHRPRFGAIGTTVAVLIAVSGVSAVANYNEFSAIWEYTKWAVATGTTLIALILADPLRRTLMRAFAVAAACGAIVTMAMLYLDPSGGWVERFAVLGYGGSAAVNARTAVVGGGEVLRASGLYVDPNSAGLVFLMAAGVAGTVFVGAVRIGVLAVLVAGIAGTLSRSAIVSVLVAMIVLVVATKLDAGRRLLFVVLGVAALSATLLVPAVSSRLVGSFGGRDVGATARADALAQYPQQMEGAWLFGHGWYLREFWDPVFGYHVNYAANTPLIVIYRGGIFVGIVFLVLMVVALVLAWRSMRRGEPGAGVIGGVLFGLVFVAFQLDFPVVTMPPLAMCLALLLAQVHAVAAHRDAALPIETLPLAAPVSRRPQGVFA